MTRLGDTYPEKGGIDAARPISLWPDPAQYGELWLPGRAAVSTVVIVHGGFWRARYDLSLGRPLAADLAPRGYAVWNLEYRRVGAGGGWPATFEDIAAGIDLLADLPVAPPAVVAVGHSAGGHLAAWAAGRARLRRARPGAARGSRDSGRRAGRRPGPGGLRPRGNGRYGRARPDGRRAWGAGRSGTGSPTRWPRCRWRRPCCALHSRADGNVPFRYSERYVQAATGAGGNAYLYETSGDHFTLIDPGSPDWPAVTARCPGCSRWRTPRQARRAPATASEPGADLPQVGEGGPEQRAAQVRRAG